jgi:hypothetical protein
MSTQRHKRGWYFNRLQPSDTVVAVEPSGREHVIKHGRMDTAEGMALLDAMLRDLTAEPPTKDLALVPAPETNFGDITPLTDDEIKRMKPVCADFVSFRAGVRAMELRAASKGVGK